MKNITNRILILLIVLAGCVASKNNLEKEASELIKEFESKLSNGEEVHTLFKSQQSKEELMKGIAILQNKDAGAIQSRIVDDEIGYDFSKKDITVIMPVELTGGSSPEKIDVQLILSRRNGKYVITKLDADALFQRYNILKTLADNDTAYDPRELFLQKIIDKAETLKGSYDKIVWALLDTMNYFYVTKGKFDIQALDQGLSIDGKMGLIDSTGQVIVPTEYDIVGIPSIAIAGAVEVSKGGKFGYFSMKGKQLIPPDYDWIYPYAEDGVLAIVRKDSSFGWLDLNYAFHRDFPSTRVHDYIYNLTFLTDSELTLGSSTKTILDLGGVDLQHQGGLHGLIVPPSYLVKNGIFSLIESDLIFLVPGEGTFQYGTTSIANKNYSPLPITETITAFIADLTKHIVGSRGELYTTSKIILVNNNLDTLSSISHVAVSHNFPFRKLPNGLFETAYVYDSDQDGPYFEEEYPEMNFPYHQYYSFDGGKLNHLRSPRRFCSTEFIKLDSSYLEGDFNTGKTTTDGGYVQGKSTFASPELLIYMRNEILAANGFIFQDDAIAQRFKNDNWKGLSSDYNTIYASASEIDRFNLDFIAHIIGPYQEKGT